MAQIFHRESIFCSKISSGGPYLSIISSRVVGKQFGESIFTMTNLLLMAEWQQSLLCDNIQIKCTPIMHRWFSSHFSSFRTSVSFTLQPGFSLFQISCLQFYKPLTKVICTDHNEQTNIPEKLLTSDRVEVNTSRLSNSSLHSMIIIPVYNIKGRLKFADG